MFCQNLLQIFIKIIQLFIMIITLTTVIAVVNLCLIFDSSNQIFVDGLTHTGITSFKKFRIEQSGATRLFSISSSSQIQPQVSSDDNENSKIDLLYDSECPICAMEVEFLKKRDIHNRIRYTDLSSPDYNPADHGNVQFADGMRKIRAVLPDQTVVTGVEVFRQTYNAIGLGWVFYATSLPIIGKAADALYDVWAEHRLRITGRGDLADQLKKQSEILQSVDEAECVSDACELNWDD